MEKLKEQLIDGIQIEEEFITTYMSVIKDEGFLQYFPDQKKTKELLEVLITESTWHKNALEEILATL